MTLADYESQLFGYRTSVSWQTFAADLAVQLARDTAFKIVLIFLALAAIETAVPFAWQLFGREARARFGRGAVVSALSAIAILGSVRLAMQALASLFPRAAMIRGFYIPESVTVPLPSLIDLAQALYSTLTSTGAIAMAAVAIASLPRKRGLAAAITIGIIFCATLDPGVTTIETPLMLIRAAVTAVTLWLIARFVLNGNVLAWPLAIFLAELLPGALFLLQNHRFDLRMHAVIELAVAATIVAFCAAKALGSPGGRARELTAES
jgi:hypothetical protein